MQTRTYGELFKLISALCGTGQQLAVPEQDQLRQFINRRFQEAFDSSTIWPRYLVTSEERKIIALTITNAAGTGASDVNGNYFFIGSQKSGGSGHADAGSSIYYKTTRSDDGSTISATLIYQASNAWVVRTGGVVSYTSDGIYNVSTARTNRYAEGDNNKKSFPYDVELWTVANGADQSPHIAQKQSIPYEETLGHSSAAKNNIGEFLKIHRKKAFINNSSIEYDFSVDFDGANILNIVNTTDNTAFVTYKKQFTPYTITTAYYDSALEVPQEFYNYIAHTAFADFLRMQGKNEQAVAEEQVGAFFLAQELEKVDIISNNNTVNKRFSTYVNRQSR